MIWDVLQGLGAGAGLVSALYLAWQHFTQDTPTAIIVRKRSYDLAPRLDLHLRITNRSERPLILRFEDNTAQNELRVVHENSIHAAVVQAMGRPVEVVLDPETSRDFRLARRADHEQIDDDNELQVRFRWRYPQSVFRPRPRLFTVQMRKGDYDALGALEGEAEDA